MNFFNKSIVGLEMDSKEIRAVHLEGNPDKPHLKNFARLSLDRGIVRDGRVESSDELGLALSRLWSEKKLNCRDVVLGINNQDVIVRFANYPKVPKEKLDNLIRFQAQDHIPIPMDAVELDYAVTGETENNNVRLYHILLVAGRKKMLFDFIHALQSARLNIIDISVSMLSAARLLPNHLRTLPVAMVNLSGDFGNIVIMNNNEPGMARTIRYNSQLASTIRVFHERSYGIDFKLEDETLHETCRSLAEEIRSSVSYYQNQNPNTSFRHIILTGSLARIPRLSDTLRQMIQTDVMLIHPDRFGGHMTGVDRHLFQPSDYATCASLAIHGLEV